MALQAVPRGSPRIAETLRMGPGRGRNATATHLGTARHLHNLLPETIDNSSEHCLDRVLRHL
jgi:hypothetical protein